MRFNHYCKSTIYVSNMSVCIQYSYETPQMLVSGRTDVPRDVTALGRGFILFVCMHVATSQREK